MGCGLYSNVYEGGSWRRRVWPLPSARKMPSSGRKMVHVMPWRSAGELAEVAGKERRLLLSEGDHGAGRDSGIDSRAFGP